MSVFRRRINMKLTAQAHNRKTPRDPSQEKVSSGQSQSPLTPRQKAIRVLLRRKHARRTNISDMLLHKLQYKLKMENPLQVIARKYLRKLSLVTRDHSSTQAVRKVSWSPEIQYVQFRRQDDCTSIQNANRLKSNMKN